MRLNELIASRLDERRQAGLLRQRNCIIQNHDAVLSSEQGHWLDFASNDYLGLRNHPDVMQAWAEGLVQFGNGSGASPLVTGYMQPHRELEQQIAHSLKREAAILFSSGFAANQSVCRALFDEGGVILADKLMHASFIDGALASAATFKRYKHNDYVHLNTLLSQTCSDPAVPVLIASEGVFSMDGDSPDMQQLASLARDYGAWLMIDDAHGIGVRDGQYYPAQADVPVVMGTFGKALGTGGAFIAGSQTLIDYLVNFARDYVYSTALPPAQAHATIKAWQLMQQGQLTTRLRANISSFKHKCADAQIALMTSDSAIQLVQVGQPKRTMQLAEALKHLGIWVGAMRAPTVPKGTDRLRITLSAKHGEKDINALVDALQLVLAKSDEELALGSHS